MNSALRSAARSRGVVAIRAARYLMLAGFTIAFVAAAGCGSREHEFSAASSESGSVAGFVAIEGEYLTPLSPGDIAGEWSAGAGRGRFEAGPDGWLTVTNESGMASRGTVTGDTFSVADWNVAGRLTADRKCFVWSNGVIWHR